MNVTQKKTGEKDWDAFYESLRAFPFLSGYLRHMFCQSWPTSLTSDAMLTLPAFHESSSCLFSILEKKWINTTLDRWGQTKKPVEPDEGSLEQCVPAQNKFWWISLHIFFLSTFIIYLFKVFGTFGSNGWHLSLVEPTKMDHRWPLCMHYSSVFMFCLVTWLLRGKPFK